MTFSDVMVSIIAGIIGTFIMDFTNLILSKFNVISSVQPLLLGRLAHGWVRGKFIYDNVSSVESVDHEYLKGQITHYFIGTALSFFYVVMVILLDTQINIYLWVILYGMVTTFIPWFFLFPSMGIGIAGTKAPGEAKMPRTSFINHFNYGVGLALGYYIMKTIPVFADSIFLR